MEIVGGPSSGRTSLFVACLRNVTREGALAALVDTEEVFDPASAALAGVNLSRLLWVRCGGRRDRALGATDLLVRCPALALVGLDLGETPAHIPLTAAFRLKLAVRRTGATLVILGRRRMVGPAASLAVRTERKSIEWIGPGMIPTRLARMCTEVRVLRARGALGRRSTADFAWWEA